MNGEGSKQMRSSLKEPLGKAFIIGHLTVLHLLFRRAARQTVTNDNDLGPSNHGQTKTKA